MFLDNRGQRLAEKPFRHRPIPCRRDILMSNVFDFCRYGCGETIIRKEELIEFTPYAREESMMRPMSRAAMRVAVLQSLGRLQINHDSDESMS